MNCIIYIYYRKKRDEYLNRINELKKNISEKNNIKFKPLDINDEQV